MTIQAQAAILDYLASTTSSPDNDNVWPFFLRVAQAENIPDKLRACALFALHRCLQYRYGNEQKMLDVFAVCNKFVATPAGEKVAPENNWVLGPLARFAAVRTLARYSSDDEEVCVAPLIEIVDNGKDLDRAWIEDEPKFDVNWAFFTAAPWEWKKYHKSLELSFANSAVANLEVLSRPVLRKVALPKLLDLLINHKRYIMAKVLVALFMLDPLDKNCYFGELQKEQQEVLKTIDSLPELYSGNHLEEEFLNAFNIPTTYDELHKLVTTPLPAELVANPRYPTFEGLEDINWDGLNHAYGAAGDVPRLVRLVASPDPQKRRRAYNSLWSGPYHQGSVYSCDPPLAKWLIKLLQYEMVPGKDGLVHYLTHLAVSWPQSYEIERFCESKRLDSKYDERDDIKNTFEAVKSGFDVFLNLLQTSTQISLRVCCARILTFFPSQSGRSAPVMLDLLHNDQQVAKSSILRAALLVCLSNLAEPQTDQFNQLLVLSDSIWENTSEPRFARFSAACCSMKMRLDEPGVLPQPLKDFLLELACSEIKVPVEELQEHSKDDDESLAWPFETTKLITDLIAKRANEFTQVLITKMMNQTDSKSALDVIKVLVGITFESPSFHTSSSGRQADWYDMRGIVRTELQRKVLEAIVQCDAAWQDALTAEQLEASKPAVPFSVQGSPLQNMLNYALGLQGPATRSQLQLSLEKLDTLPPLSKDALAAGGDGDFNIYRIAKFND